MQKKLLSIALLATMVITNIQATNLFGRNYWTADTINFFLKQAKRDPIYLGMEFSSKDARNAIQNGNIVSNLCRAFYSDFKMDALQDLSITAEHFVLLAIIAALGNNFEGKSIQSITQLPGKIAQKTGLFLTYPTDFIKKYFPKNKNQDNEDN